MNETFFLQGFSFSEPQGGVGMWVRKLGRSPLRFGGHPAAAGEAACRRSPFARFLL